MHRTAALLAPLLLLLVPIAHAQPVPAEPEVRVTTPSESTLAMPETESVVIPFTVEVRCTPADFSHETTHVKVAVEHAPAYARAVVNPPATSYTDDPADCLNPATESMTVIPFEVTVKLQREAPAFQDVAIELNVTLERGDHVFGPYSATVHVTPDYVAGIEAVPVHSTLRVAANDQGKIPVEVTNLANGVTLIRGEIRPTSSHALDAVVPPAPFVLESQAAHGAAARDTKTVYVMVRTPAGVGSGNEYTFDLVLTGEFAGKDVSRAETDTVVVELAVIRAAPDDPIEAYGALAPAPGVAWVAVALFLGLGLRLRGRTMP